MTRAQDCRPTLAPKPTRCFLRSSLTSRSPGFLKAKENAALSWEDNDIYFFWLFFFFFLMISHASSATSASALLFIEQRCWWGPCNLACTHLTYVSD